MRSTRQITVIGKRVTARTLCATTDKWESCRISAHWKLVGSVQEAASDREACMIRVADLTLSVAGTPCACGMKRSGRRLARRWCMARPQTAV